MDLADAVLAVMWVGVTLYAVFAGADFGAGFWDLVAGGTRAGAAQRSLIEHAIGPVWEANHVWLIFVLVILWTAFPLAFAAVMSTLLVPFTAAAVGIILRGSAFAFRKSVPTVELKRAFGAVFASSSIVTPFFLGAVAGAVASGRVPVEAPGDLIGSWWNPTSVLGGVLAVCACAYQAAVFLAADAERRDRHDLLPGLRRRAIGAGLVTGAVAAAGVVVLRADAPHLFDGLTGPALPLVLASAAGGIGSLVLEARRRFRAARLAAVVAVAAVLWGWAVGQHPWLLVDELTIAAGAGHPATLTAVVIALAIGSLLLVPPLVALLVLAQRGELEAAGADIEAVVAAATAGDEGGGGGRGTSGGAGELGGGAGEVGGGAGGVGGGAGRTAGRPPA